MKKGLLISILLGALLVFTGCDEKQLEIINNDFEDVVLTSGLWFDGSSKIGTLVEGQYHYAIPSGSVQLLNVFTENEWFSYWSGFAVSAAIDTVTRGFANQYSTIAGSGAGGSSKFALVYDTATLVLSYINGYQQPQSVMLTNSTFAYHDIKNGSSFSKKFGANDWFKVIIRGYFGTTATGTVEYYLADFRNGKSFIANTWNQVDLTSLGTVDKMTFEFDSSDKGVFGVNTPKYVCVDNLKVALSENCGCIR